MADDAPLQHVVHELIERMRPHLWLDRWQLRLEFGPGEFTGQTTALPEYWVGTIWLDPDRLSTGDELDEIVSHELAHCHTWPVSEVADELAIALAECLPESAVASLGKFLKRQVERAEEVATQQVGRSYCNLFRALWAAEAEVADLKVQMKTLRKQVKAASDS